MHPYIALITLCTVLLLGWTGGIVGRARGRYGVRAPATTGPEGFDRAFRVQANTNEAALMFLPALWVAAYVHRADVAAALGALWLVGRILYIFTYLDPAKTRTIGFALGAIATVGLVVQGLWGVGWPFLMAA
jgi:glutathione S-transferase